jgi:hypothetical protein
MSTATHQSTWDARIARARELASIRPAARDLLLFYATLAEYQRTLAAGARDAGTFDIDIVIKAIPGFLDWLRSAGRAELADSVDVDCVTSALRQKSNDSHSLPAEAGSHPAEAGSHPSGTGSHPSGIGGAHPSRVGVASGFSRQASTGDRRNFLNLTRRFPPSASFRTVCRTSRPDRWSHRTRTSLSSPPPPSARRGPASRAYGFSRAPSARVR